MIDTLKKTELTDWHCLNGGKMVEYAGYEMPVQYNGVMSEHTAVRESAGLFDISHMGEIIVSGAEATEWLEGLITNRISKSEPGQVTYTAMCNDAGFVLDDMLIYRLTDSKWMIVCNAANHEKISGWLNENIRDGVDLKDISDQTTLIAVQGPKSKSIVSKLELIQKHTDNFEQLEFYKFFEAQTDNGNWIISRTGYTGEHGYELYIPGADAVALWEELMDVGSEFGIEPVGLAARDTLRFEMGYCLYGHELSEGWSPLEAGIGWAVKMKKSHFIGLESLRLQKAEGVPKRVRGFEIIPQEVKGKLRPAPIARQSAELFCGTEKVGFVTSGTKSPSTGKSLFMALVDADYLDSELEVEIRGKRSIVMKTGLPFIITRVKGDPEVKRELSD